MDTLTALKGDFKLFLQALWAQLDLPSPTRAQYSIADYIQHGPKRLQIQAFRGVGKIVGLLEPLCCGHSSTTQKRRL
jgi:hypothetical protein